MVSMWSLVPRWAGWDPGSTGCHPTVSEHHVLGRLGGKCFFSQRLIKPWSQHHRLLKNPSHKRRGEICFRGQILFWTKKILKTPRVHEEGSFVPTGNPSTRSLYSFTLSTLSSDSFAAFHHSWFEESKPQQRQHHSGDRNQPVGWLEWGKLTAENFQMLFLVQITHLEIRFQYICISGFTIICCATVAMRVSSRQKLVQIPALSFISVWSWTCFLLTSFVP